MTITHKVWDFPSLAIQSQLFHVPGSYFDGGLTSGGARIMSPEPGGRSVLEVTLSLQTKEWGTPFSSWLMSKINGELFKIQLIRTPQLISITGEELIGSSRIGIKWNNNQNWNNGQGWADDGAYLETASIALEGGISLNVETASFGEIIRHGHVLGIGDQSYKVDDVEYDGSIANLSLKPPLRKNVSIDEMVYLKPYFIGSIANGSEIRASYEASKLGAIQLNTITFNEALI